MARCADRLRAAKRLADHIMRLIKGASVRNECIHGPGYVLLGTENAYSHQTTYRLPLPDRAVFHFVFAFQGVGSHFLAKVDRQKGLIALYHVKDGIPVYLNHVLVKLPSNAVIDIFHDTDFLSITSSGYGLINVLHDGSVAGEWGFNIPREKRLLLPDVEIAHQQRQNLEWVVLGDGFSNNRWPNRHFVSWPELLFGPKVSYLNACVAAANSRRVLEVAKKLVSRMQNAQVIVAMGTDDLIEGSGLESFLAHLDDLVALLAEAGVRQVWIANLPPINSKALLIPEWNETLRQRLRGTCITLVDIHTLLSRKERDTMAQGEYPSANGQWEIARHLAQLLGGLAPQRREILTPHEGLFGKIALRLSGLLARAGSHNVRLNI